MSTPNKLFGDNSAQLQPAKTLTETATETTATLTYRGPRSACMAIKPSIGVSIPGWPGYVVRTSITADSSAIATLTVELGPLENGDGEGSEITEQNVSVEVMQIEKPLERLPLWENKSSYPKGMDDPIEYRRETYKNAEDYVQKIWDRLFGEDVEKFSSTVGGVIARIQQCPPEERTILMFPRDPGGEDLSDAAVLLSDFFKKWDKGVRGYPVYTPVVRLTRKTTIPPSLGKLGQKESPPGIAGSRLPKQANGDPYVWVKTNASYSWSGRFGTIDSVQEWTGLDEVDNDIHP